MSRMTDKKFTPKFHEKINTDWKWHYDFFMGFICLLERTGPEEKNENRTKCNRSCILHSFIKAKDFQETQAWIYQHKLSRVVQTEHNKKQANKSHNALFQLLRHKAEMKTEQFLFFQHNCDGIGIFTRIFDG